MLKVLKAGSKEIQIPDSLDSTTLWYDLLDPQPSEVKEIEKMFAISIPTLEEMQEIETSSRLYKEGDWLYLTALVIARTDNQKVVLSPITFILGAEHLVTIRYVDPKPFAQFVKTIDPKGFQESQSIFLGLLDSIVERLADLLENNISEIDLVSTEIFKINHSKPHDKRAMPSILNHLGKQGDLNAKIRESLETLERLLIFFQNQCENSKALAHVNTIHKDVKSIMNHASFTFSQINFLLQASLGFISIEQNETIKIFSVAAVIFLPPTLIASIYGMNFDKIPELHWLFGYPFALLLMCLSVIGAFVYFKRKGWL